MAITEKDLPIIQGDTFNVIARWENGDLIVRKPITGISFASGAPRFTANGHGCVNGWRAHDRINGIDKRLVRVETTIDRND